MAKYDYSKVEGARFNKLIAVKFSHKKSNIRYYLCRCDCGKELTVSCYSLFDGNTQSCGCYHREQAAKYNSLTGLPHWATSKGKEERIYGIWRNVKSRCFCKSNIRYLRYGGRGITMCSEWRISFWEFKDWSYRNGYADNLTIDRIDNDGNYEPSNCRWITRAENNRNKPTTKSMMQKADNLKSIWLDIGIT